jgi:hypothetical protein
LLFIVRLLNKVKRTGQKTKEKGSVILSLFTFYPQSITDNEQKTLRTEQG